MVAVPPSLMSGTKRIEFVDASNKALVVETVPIAVHVVLFSEYCQLPVEALVSPVMAMPFTALVSTSLIPVVVDVAEPLTVLIKLETKIAGGVVFRSQTLLQTR